MPVARAAAVVRAFSEHFDLAGHIDLLDQLGILNALEVVWPEVGLRAVPSASALSCWCVGNTCSRTTTDDTSPRIKRRV